MTMRGSARRAIQVDVTKFGWDRSAVVTLRHSTLPWYDEFALEISLDASPLTSLKDLGIRDRLSLTGQFAAHQAFLKFAGLSDDIFDATQWAVIRKRSTDCRLVRVTARCAYESPPALTLIQQFADVILSPPLDLFRQTWARAETAYQEIDLRLREDAAADLRWLRAAASGRLASPGTEFMRGFQPSAGRLKAPSDLSAFRALATIDRAVTILGDVASPLARYSGIAALGMPLTLNETEIVERMLAFPAHRAFVLTNLEAFDDASRRVVDLLQAAGFSLWIGPEGHELPETRWFVLSPRLEAYRPLELRLAALPADTRDKWIADFVASSAFDRYLDEGDLPPSASDGAINRLREPFRSYIAAVALFGVRVRVTVVNRFLERLMSTARTDELVTEGIASIDDGVFVFESDEIRQEAIRAIPPASRAFLSCVAAEVAEAHGDKYRAAALFAEGGDYPHAVAILETIQWHSAAETITALRAVPREARSSKLDSVLAEALVASGRYRDARPMASSLLLAQIERRTGEYAAALRRLDRLKARDFESELLRGELLRLLDRPDEARLAFDACQPVTDDQRIRHGYQRAVLSNESGVTGDDSWLQIEFPSRDYYAARIGVYRAIAARRLDDAIASASRAVKLAGTIADRVDATLDLLFTLFCSGDWEAARLTALDALLLVEETQGDRAAGGILFLLACLSADDGQWTHSVHLLERLRSFYSGVHDVKRLVELELVAAMIDLSRGHLASAARAARTVVSSTITGQIREAAALILDEIDWIEGRDTPLCSTGATPNIELTDRHRILRARRGLAHDPVQGVFAAALVDWEERGGAPPDPITGSHKLMLFRAALGRRRKEIADGLAAELKITIAMSADTAEPELRVLRVASTLRFPFAPHDFAPTAWRYATRNRLGQWHEIGSLPPMASLELDTIVAEEFGDWIACSDRELLYLEGLGRWASESRGAIASLFRVRAEHHRLRRLMDEEPIDSVTHVEGIVGESPAMREVFDLVARVSRRDVAVCILGESGTGKELVARALHRQSLRRQKLFTPINCAALPENLIESELFGHVRGAFTGADRDRAGLIEATDGGTLFLDEIGEMPLAAQAKLLRFLQEGEFRRVGETQNRSADARVVTATNRKLEAAVEEGRFREDLYYRIRGVEIVMPPLRDRANDIPLLATHFLGIERQKHRSGPMRLSSEVEAAFASYHWPGNVRELQNTIRGSHALAGEAREIALEHLPERLRRIKINRTPIGSYQDAVARFRRDLIEKSLAQANGNQNQAAAMLKISRQALAYQIRELGILVSAGKRPRT